MKRYLLVACMCFALFSSLYSLASAQELQPEQRNQLIALSSDALISSRDNQWEATQHAVQQLKQIWSQNSEATATATAEAKAVSDALGKAEQALAQASSSPQPAVQAVSELAKAVDRYSESKQQNDQPKEKAHKQIQALLPMLEKSLASVKAGDWTQAKQSYNSFVNGWGKAENLVRAENAQIYAAMEVKISGARIAMNTEPPDSAKSAAKLQELILVVQDYLSGKAAEAPDTAAAGSGGQPTITSQLQLLDTVHQAIQSKQAETAAGGMDQFIANWPLVEGEVMTRSPDTYTSIETKMVSVPTLLLSKPPAWEKAEALLNEMKTELQPFAQASAYTAWDAALILFREGLEAILVIASLIAFLNRSGNGDKRKWIWSGAGAGVIASAMLAVVLSLFLSNLTTGGSRETIEGITGLIAVVFMVTIGAWLHKKSNLKNWNQYVAKAIGTSLAAGTLWSLAFTAFLAVIREGAETLIFYIGMASTIRLSDLLTGVGGALVALIIIGYAIIKMSSRIPVRPFFLVAGLLLYYMAFKFVGVSIHALQVTGQLPSHLSEYLFNVPSLGLYANWETTLPQLVVLLIVLLNIALNMRKGPRKPVQSPART